MPVVPRSALATIHGHVRVAVLVIVDPSGDVADAILENPGRARTSPAWQKKPPGNGSSLPQTRRILESGS